MLTENTVLLVAANCRNSRKGISLKSIELETVVLRFYPNDDLVDHLHV